jgi:predicted ferric reductase
MEAAFGFLQVEEIFSSPKHPGWFCGPSNFVSNVERDLHS